MQNNKLSYVFQIGQAQRASKEEFRLSRTDSVNYLQVHPNSWCAPQYKYWRICKILKATRQWQSNSLVTFLAVFSPASCLGFFHFKCVKKISYTNTIQNKIYNELLRGNEHLTDIVYCDWGETFICLWEEQVCSHMSQQKESDSGYPPKQGHWSILRRGSMGFPREAKACFLGHFAACLKLIQIFLHSWMIN